MAKQKTINDKPVYEAKMQGEDAGIICVSLVDMPAVKSNFVAYAEQQPVQEYAVTDADKQRVFGCVLRADFPIFRRNEDGQEYYIVFRAEQIRAFAQRYLAEGRQNAVDTHHNFVAVDGCEMVQYFIKDTAKGIAPEGFEGIADGSLFAEYQVTDPDLWERIKAGEFKGFSVAIVEEDVPVQETYSSKDNMTLLDKVKAALAKGVSAVEQELAAALETYGRIATDKGVLVWGGEDELSEGIGVWSEGEDGNRVELEDGEYTTNDSRVVVVEGGIVKEIREAVAEQPAEPEPEAEPEQQAEEGAPAADPEAEPEPEAEQPAEDEKDKRIAELEARIADLEAENKELKDKLAEPAAQTAHEAYKQATRVEGETDAFQQIRYLRKKRSC